MLGETIAGAGLGYIVGYYKEEDTKTMAGIGAASGAVGSIVGNYTGRPILKTMASVGTFVVGKKMTSNGFKEESLLSDVMEGAIVSIGSGVAGRMVNGWMAGHNNDGTSLLDYTRGQAP